MRILRFSFDALPVENLTKQNIDFDTVENLVSRLEKVPEMNSVRGTNVRLLKPQLQTDTTQQYDTTI